MNEVTITFDRVFDIARTSRRNRVVRTEFGFQSGDLKLDRIAVPGAPRIEDGMTVTALLERPGEWRTLLGWVNHATGEIACQSAASNIAGIGPIVLGSLLAYHFAGTQPVFAALVAVVSIACCVGSVIGMRKSASARRRLEAVRMALKAAPAQTRDPSRTT